MKYSEAKQYLKEGMKFLCHSSNVSAEIGEYIVKGGCNKYRGEFFQCFDENDEIEILTNPDGSKWVHPDQKFTIAGFDYKGLYNSMYKDMLRYSLQPSWFIKNYYAWDTAGLSPKKGSIMSAAVSFVKKQALKATNPDEYELREAGLHNECGELTDEGEELRDQFLEELVHAKMVETAKAINSEKKEKK